MCVPTSDYFQEVRNGKSDSRFSRKSDFSDFLLLYIVPEESRKSEKTTSENRPIVTGLKRWWQVPPGIPETMDSPTNPTVSVFYGENVP